MPSGTYKRGQVEWALWRAFTLGRSPGNGPPQIFKTRIKRLLDLDREFDADKEELRPPSEYAFVSSAAGGSGIEVAYAPFDAFCLGLALDLLDVGFKQGEIVFVMRYLRPELETWFPKLVAAPSLIDRQTNIARQHPKLPTTKRGRVADARVFVVLNRVEVSEVFSGLRAKAGKPVFLSPEFCSGVGKLAKYLDDLLPLHRRTVMVLEIAAIAQAVSEFLQIAPFNPRGRPVKGT